MKKIILTLAVFMAITLNNNVDIVKADFSQNKNQIQEQSIDDLEKEIDNLFSDLFKMLSDLENS